MNNSTLDMVLDYYSRGWMPIPIPHGSKNPNRKGWQKKRWERDDLPQCFNNGHNVGLLLGEPSGGLVDVDLDSPEAIALASSFLPPTSMIGGRTSFPRSHQLTLIEGDPSVGKSWLTCALATAVAAGTGPAGWTKAAPANALMMSVEDGLGDTIRPRLDGMNADVSHIFAIEGAMTFNDAGILRLEGMILKIKPVLVIIDPLVAYMDAKVDLNKANETRAVTARLSLLAEKHGCAIVAVRHLTKGGRDRAIYRGIGSIDITAACRSALLVGCDPGDKSKRAIVHIKSNLAEKGDSIGYEIRGGSSTGQAQAGLQPDRYLLPQTNQAIAPKGKMQKIS